MKQLNSLDTAFLNAERPNAPMNATPISVFDRSTAPSGDVTFDDIFVHLEGALPLIPRFRQKLVRVPGNVDRPWWVDDAHFDLEYHVRHIALPRPGTWRQLMVQAARLQARPLDRSRPLWELYVIDGVDAVDDVPEGGFAFVQKLHHAAFDGKAMTDMGAVLTSPSPDAPPRPVEPWLPEPEPSGRQLLGKAATSATRLPGQAARLAGRVVPGLGRAADARRHATEQAGLAPHTRFNGPITPHRVIDAHFTTLDELKSVRATVEGATINDVALAVYGGALRRYLGDVGELPEHPLQVLVPISTRTDDGVSELGNELSAMVVNLETNVADPLERLARVHESTRSTKEIAGAVGERNLTDLLDFLPLALVGPGLQLLGQLGERGIGGVINTLISNIPGVRTPAYVAGARQVRAAGAAPVIDGMGLINHMSGYCDQLAFGFTACRRMLPDPERYTAAIADSLEEITAAV